MMTVKEAERLGVMKEIERKKTTYQEASEVLVISRRQVIRIMKRYRAQGSEGVISKKKGIPSPRKLNIKTKATVLNFVQEKYRDFGPTFASEKLAENHGIDISRETLRKLLIEEGIWKAKKKKERKIHPRRTRRPRIGELIQIDGSYHQWFEDRGEKCCLIVFIDDATSQIMYGKFCKAETTKEYMEGVKSYIKRYGKPLGFYSDKHSVFRVNRKEVKNGPKKTQFGRALHDLKIELICANSPQAKGRVERANGTLQDRLVKEMRLKGLKTIEEGNRYLTEFIKSYNQKFGKPAASKEDGHRELKENLEEILALKTERQLTKDLSFQYQNQHYSIKTKTPNRLVYKKVEVLDHWEKGLTVKYQGQELKYNAWEERKDERPQIANAKELEVLWIEKRRKKPSKRHPWR